MKLLKIILTNWVHLPGFYVVTSFSTLLFRVLGLAWQDESWDFVLNNTFSSVNALLFLYGRIIIGGFYAVLIVLDVVCFKLLKIKVIEALVAEWLLMSLPFIYWAFKHQYWLWIPLSLSFLGTQLVRKSIINKVLNLSA